MNSSLRHRGPDDQGIAEFGLAPQPGCPSGGPAFRNSDFKSAGSNQSGVGSEQFEIRNPKSEIRVGLGNTRLAIIDLSARGHQPMRDDEAGLTITYNGEIYNFRELRAEISDVFGPWRSNTDTEVVLRAYRRWGVDAFAKLRGMFALAIWDSKRQELVLARDRFGIKPLYYTAISNQQSAVSKSLVFASELRALLATGLVERKLSRTGLASYLEYGSTQAPLTIIDGVRSLLPGHYLYVRPDDFGLRVSDCEFQNVTNSNGNQARAQSALPTSNLSREQAVVLLREKLTESVRLHLVSDVPLGVFLSGGMDSSALVALMSRATNEKPKTFSVVFDETQFSELPHSRLVAQQFQTDHREIHLTEDQLLAMLPAALAAMDQPTMDGVNTFVVSKAVKEAGLTVALSGLGGDELFAGYSTFRRALRLKEMQSVPAGWRSPAARVGTFFSSSARRNKFWQLMASDGSPAAAYAVTRQLFAPEQVARIANCELRMSNLEGGNHGDREVASAVANSQCAIRNSQLDPVNAISLLELQGYMSNTLLRDTDCMSMAHSLEVRVPFVDSEIVSYVLALPGEWKLNGSRPKPLLADALGDLLPRKFLERPKMGFTLPLEKWMQRGLNDEISRVFRDNERLTRIGLDSVFVGAVWQRFLRSPRSVGWSRPWSLYVLAKWCEVNGVTN